MAPKEIELESPFAGADDSNFDDGPLASDSLDDGIDMEATEDVTPEPTPEPVAEKTPEPEAVEEPETKPEVAEEPETEPEVVEDKPKTIQVPKSRLDAEIAKRRELEQRLSELEKGSKPADVEINGLDGLDVTSMFDHVLNGDLEKANEAFQQSIMQVAKATAQTVTERLTNQINQAPEVTKAQLELDQVADRIVAEYDVFDRNSTNFDETLTNEVLDMRGYFENKGYAPAQALEKAVNLVVSGEGLVAKTQPKPPARKTEVNIEQKIKAAEAQPPKTAGDRNASEPQVSFNIATMSDGDLDKLSEVQLAQLRGDYI